MIKYLLWWEQLIKIYNNIMYYNIKQFSEIINITTQTLRNWDKTDKLKPIRLEFVHRNNINY